MKKSNLPVVERKDGKMELSPSHVQAIKDVERVGTSMMQVGQQMILVTEQILIEDFGFTEEQLQHLEERQRQMLSTLAEVERKGLSVLSMHDMESVAELANIRYNRLLEKETGIVLPKGTKIHE